MPEVIEVGEKLPSQSLFFWIADIIFYLRVIALILGVIFIIYSAFLFFSGHKEEKIKEGKGTLFWSIIGVIVSFAAFFILSMVLNFISPEIAVGIDPTVLQYAKSWSSSGSFSSFNYDTYIRDITSQCRQIGELKTMGIPLVSARFCGRIVISSGPQGPCYGYLTIPRAGFPCCSGLQPITINNKTYCLETCGGNKKCNYGKCTQVNVGGSTLELCL